MKTDKDIHAHLISLSEPEIKPYSDIRNFGTSDFIPFGADNMFPQALALFCRTSPNHRGILNSKHTYFMGDGLTTEDQSFLDLLDDINYQGESIEKFLEKIDTDYGMFGNGYWELITDRNRSFLWFNHIDATKVRLEKGQERVILHPDWSKDTGKYDKYRKYLPVYPQFESDPGVEDFPAYRSVYHQKKYEPEFVYYGVPQYLSSKDSIQIDLKTNKWNLSRLKNSFRVSGILVVPVKDPQESKDVMNYIKKNYTGEDNQAKLLTITKGRATENQKAEQAQLIETKQHDEGSWIKLHEQSLADLIVSHQWFRTLTGIADNTGFDTQRILNEYEVAKNTVINNRQKEYIEIISELYRDVIGLDVPEDFKFINRPPLDTDNYKYVWELRQEKGLDFDENDPAQQIIVMPNQSRSRNDGSNNSG